MTIPRAAVTGWLWPLALEAAAHRVLHQRPGGISLALRWGPVWAGSGNPGGGRQLSLGRAGKGFWEPLCATVRPLVPHANCSQAGLRKSWAAGWGLPNVGIQQVLEVGEAGGWGWG